LREAEQGPFVKVFKGVLLSVKVINETIETNKKRRPLRGHKIGNFKHISKPDRGGRGVG